MCYEYPEFRNPDDEKRCMVCGDHGDIKLFGQYYCNGCYADFKHELRKDNYHGEKENWI